MTLLKIARMGHPVLLRWADPIDDPTAREIRRLVHDMIDTMKDAGGVGLAAPQVHISSRIIIFSAPRERGDQAAGATEFAPLTALINPSYEAVGEEMVPGWEGCLSIPGLTGVVPRHRHIRYRGIDPATGEPVERDATGFHARVVQHEIDHLDGVLYTMRMTNLGLLAFTDELRHFTPQAEAEDDEE
jgi:peptide deformylase